MKKLLQKLEQLDLPEISMPNFESRLKKSLLHDQKRSFYFLNIHSMPFIQKALPLGIITVLALTIVVSQNSLFPSNTALAQEMLDKALVEIKENPLRGGPEIYPEMFTKELSPEEKESIKMKMKNNREAMLQALEKAKASNDLTYLGKETGPDGEVIEKVTFTDEKGQKYFLAIKKTMKMNQFFS